MIFVQDSSSKRSWSKNRPATTVHHRHPAKIPITQPLGFQALRTLLGQAPREGLLFSISNRGPKEDDVREAKVLA
jgi:hypothetical protein